MTPRIYFPAPPGPDDRHTGSPIELSGDELHYLMRVMRAKSGDSVQLFDGRGRRCRAEVLALEKQRALLQPGRWAEGPGKQLLSIQLVQGLSASEKMDWTIEKAVELGVSNVQPVFTRRSMIRLGPERVSSKIEHWQRLAVAACRQSGRDDLPEIKTPVALDTFLALTAGANRERLLLSPPATGQPSLPLSEWHPADEQAAKGTSLEIDLLTGPEAGFEPEEQLAAANVGFVCVQLGQLTLRTETAGMAAVAALQYRFGSF